MTNTSGVASKIRINQIQILHPQIVSKPKKDMRVRIRYYT